MRVLWFEVTEPSAYASGGQPIGGWQDSLERIVRTIPDLELIIAFVSEQHAEVKEIDGVTYVPIYTRWSFWERKFRKYWDVYVEKMLPGARRVVEQYLPDLIHIFGIEWPFGQIVAYTNVPVVVHIMGAAVPYLNASYPPSYSACDVAFRHLLHPVKLYRLWNQQRYEKNWVSWERRTWSLVENYMGRTKWDESLSRLMHPNRHYFHVDEALRSVFLTSQRKWHIPASGSIKLVSTGCSTFWKGPDMMLKVAKILTDHQVDFEWNVVGKMNPQMKQLVESKEKVRYEDCHIRFLGYQQPEALLEILCSSTLYVHTAYIENSPNSICEAQCLGVPVVSTNVGGVSSLVHDGQDGILVPANDPWQMADAIIQLASDPERMQSFSENGSEVALSRHSDSQIKQQLLACYDALTK